MKKAASIFLRADIRRRDLSRMENWLGDPLVTKYLNESKDIRSEIRAMLESVPEYLYACRFNQNRLFRLVCDEQQAIGFVSCVEVHRDAYEIIFAIGEKNLWGRGYGSCAVEKVLSLLFLEKRADSVLAKVYHGNLRSRSTLLHCGFTETKRSSELSTFSISERAYLDNKAWGDSTAWQRQIS